MLSLENPACIDQKVSGLAMKPRFQHPGLQLQGQSSDHPSIAQGNSMDAMFAAAKAAKMAMAMDG